MAKVKCSECGFLAATDIDTRRLVEVEKIFRERGTPPIKFVEGCNPYTWQESIPICFVQAYDLRQEVEKATGSNSSSIAMVHFVVNDDRDCALFTKWKQGFTPKEHREMLDRQWLLDFQANREQEDREWRVCINGRCG